jgi:hypothetical protein
MRAFLITLVIACAACSATDDIEAPPSSIAGAWNETSGVTPGGDQLGLVLTESGTTVSGTATGAGVPIANVQSYQVSGQYVRPDISLTIVPINNGQPLSGASYNLVGRAVSANTIVLNNLTLARSQNTH